MIDKTKQWEADGLSIAKYYTDKITSEGYSAETLAARDDKYINIFFDNLFEGIEIQNDTSFLDIGSGLGLLFPYMKSRNLEVGEYLGIELIEEFVKYSKETYPEHNFVVGNFISDKFNVNKKYDFVIALGVLVSRVSDYEEFLAEFIKKMIGSSKRYVLFNLVTEVDTDTLNYGNKDRVGGITQIDKKKIENILDSIEGISYKINEKRVFDDATDAFVQIRVA